MLNKTSDLFLNVKELLPHEGDIVLIHNVIVWGENWLEARVDHSLPSLFKSEDGTIPVWIGIEYMAQTISAYAGLQSLQAGQPISIGFLMGAQNYDATVPAFEKDSVVKVRVDKVFSDEINLAVFDCKIETHKLLARAIVKAIRPDDPKSILKGIS